MAAFNDLEAGSHAVQTRFWKLALGSVGVVYGDIGTSPLYALRELLHGAARDGILGEREIVGIVSLLLWTLVLIVTLKYVVLMLRADNEAKVGRSPCLRSPNARPVGGPRCSSDLGLPGPRCSMATPRSLRRSRCCRPSRGSSL